jgi:AAT family amino acid transporter/D-serine/D-alanine/glycine transporter
MSQGDSNLSRNLRARHIQLIALGGTIGVGLFLGSAKAIRHAGPGLLLAYAIGGVMVFLIMRALGELLTYRPVAGSFAVYADEFCGPFAGFATGWSYWFMWVVTAMAELTAIGIYVRYWFPAVPQWLPALVALVALYGANQLAVRVFGELEFWFALIKVVTIVGLIVGGLFVIFFHVGDLGATASFTNLWSHGGFLPFGILGVLLTLQMVTFAYQGVELIGVTAGEAENPEVVLPKATNGITYRILIFYIGALLVIMSLVPWTELSPDMSPFVFVFDKMRVPAAATIINIVVITAATSSCNSGIFSTGRMLFSLAQRGQAPRALAHLSAQREGHQRLGGRDVGRGGTELCGSRKSVRLCHEHFHHRNLVDLGNHHGRAPELPACGRCGKRASGTLPHAGSAVRELAGHRVPTRRNRDVGTG